MARLDEMIAELDKECPLVPHTGASRLYSTVRRMKAEWVRSIPLDRRARFAIAVDSGKAANNLSADEWEHLYQGLCDELKRHYPDLHSRLFPVPHRTPEELVFLEHIERLEGRPLTVYEENLCIDQAIFIGDLPDLAEDCPLCPPSDAF